MFQYSKLIETHDKDIKEMREMGGSLYIPCITKPLTELPLNGDSRHRDRSSGQSLSTSVNESVKTPQK